MIVWAVVSWRVSVRPRRLGVSDHVFFICLAYELEMFIFVFWVDAKVKLILDGDAKYWPI